MPMKLEANASFKKPRLVFLVLALALVFCVVFVGGVCGLMCGMEMLIRVGIQVTKIHLPLQPLNSWQV